MVQVIRRSLTAETRVQSHDSCVGVMVDGLALVQLFLGVLRFSRHCHSTDVACIHLIIDTVL